MINSQKRGLGFSLLLASAKAASPLLQSFRDGEFPKKKLQKSEKFLRSHGEMT